ncbi:ice-binding family protein, partial [Rhodococcus sp. EPR-279]
MPASQHTCTSTPIRRRGRTLVPLAGSVALATSALMLINVPAAEAQPTTVELGTAESYAVLAGSKITNTGPSRIGGNVGVSPGVGVEPFITGFPPGELTSGVINDRNSVAAQAKADLSTGYDDAAGRPGATSTGVELGGQTLLAGLYGSGTFGLTGTLTLDAQGNSNAVFIFQAASTLITASDSSVSLINGANPCNVFWQI